MNTSVKIVCYTVLLVATGTSCNSISKVTTTDKALSKQEFLKSPFGHDESIQSFTSQLPTRTKIARYVRRNTHEPSKSDTIYKFSYKKSELFVYKTYFNREMLMAGKIVNPEIKLTNGISVGLTRDQLLKAISNIKESSSDTIVISNEYYGRTFNFIFNNKGKVREITFSSYAD
jgi:hypothetical protein